MTTPVHASSMPLFLLSALGFALMSHSLVATSALERLDPPAPNSFSIGSYQAGSTTDVDNLTVTDLDSGALVYSNGFGSAADATKDLTLVHYPVDGGTGGGTTNYVVNGPLTRVVGGKLRLETIGFGSNGAGGYNSSSDAQFKGSLPKNFRVEFDAIRLQWPGHYGVTLFYRDPTDPEVLSAPSGAVTTNRVAPFRNDWVHLGASGSSFNRHGFISQPGEIWRVQFGPPAGNPMIQHRVAIESSNNVMTYKLNGSVLNTMDISGFVDTDGDGLTDAWERGEGRYQIVEGNFTWQQAKADAESKGGHLGTFTTAQEWDFFKTLPQLQPYRDPSSALARQIWTGGFEVLEGTWKLKWVTGETWSFSNFAPPEPSAPDTSAIAIHPFPTHPVWGTSGNVYWNDDYDHRQQPYILEFGYPTDPFKADTDGDDFNDKVESDAASDPNDAASVPKFADSDNDGVTNYRETQDGTDPNNPTSFNPLSKGLVAYYPFDKGLTDETGYGKDLDQLGDHEFVADLTKNSGQALRSPSRVNGGVMSSKESGVSGNSPRTISFWFRSDGPQLWPAGNVVLLGSRVAIDRGRGNIQIDNGYRNVETPSLEFLHQRVNHFVWTYQNKLGDSRFYVNGQPVELVFEDGFGDPETTLEGVPDGPIKIMGGPQAIGFGDRGFQGEVDNARLYDRTLTEAEVQQLYATEAGDLDSDGDGLTDAWERGFGRFSVVWGSFDLLAAQQDAAARGGKLASFSTMAEWYAASSSLPENLFAWIGATDSGSEGVWRWFDGTDWAFSNWGVGEPNNQDGIEHYAQIWGNFFPGQKNAWNDVHSGVTSSYVIEYGFPTDPFKSDSDADGLKDGVETGTGVFLSASNTGTNPLDSDTSGDGILDGEAVLWNFNPLTDHTQVLAFLRHATGVQSGRFGLYTESSVMDLNLGGVMLQKTGTQASVRFKVLSKMDLRDPAWTDRGTYLLPPIDMPGSKGFLRIRAEQP